MTEMKTGKKKQSKKKASGRKAKISAEPKKTTKKVSQKKSNRKKAGSKKKANPLADKKSPFYMEELNKELSLQTLKLNKAAKNLAERLPLSVSGQKEKQYTTFQKAIRSKRVYANPAKRHIAVDMLERYTGHAIEDFQAKIILTNFHYYTERFNALFSDSHYTKGSAFQASSSKKAGVTIIEFGIGSAMAALVMELVSVIEPHAVLFLGMCGATHPSLKVGDFILPIGAIREDAVTQHFLPSQVPALPTFKVQKFASQILVENGHDYRTGMVHSTDLRFWEFDQKFKDRIYEERVIAVEMECATLFITGFASKVSIGALLLVSDCPLKRGGIKTKKSASSVFRKYTDIHIDIGIETMATIQKRGDAIRHYRWD